MSDHIKPKFVTAKEIADKLEVNAVTVRRRERRLGLHKCRDKVCQRPRRYFTERAEAALRENGHEVVF